MKTINQCSKCQKYTMSLQCCETITSNPKPAKFSPEDKYGKYRRKAKHEILKERGII